MQIASSSIKRLRINAKFIFILKLDPKSHVYDIAILDDQFRFYEEHISILVNAITKFCYNTLNRLFGKYLITTDTEINFLDTILRTEVIYMYMSIRNQSVFSNTRFISLDTIPRRIVAHHITYLGKIKKSSQITKIYIERLWRKLVQLEKCPWITPELSRNLDNVSIKARKRQVVMRMALYYMVLKRFKAVKYKQKLELKQKEDLQSTIS